MNNNLTKKQLEDLFTASQHGMIDLDDVLEKVNIMNNKKILAQHKQFCEIWQATDGRWKTKLPDKSKKDGKKLIAKTSREKLETSIIDWYKREQEQQENPKTLKALYPKWLEMKAKESSDGNASKLDWAWNKYYADSKLVNMKITDIKVVELKEWFINEITEKQLSRRQFKEMKSLLNMLMDYAIEYELITVNVSRSVRGISAKKFRIVEKKAPEEQVFIDDEEDLIIQLAQQQYVKTKNIAYLAICLNFYLALRVGELVALHTSDFTDTVANISRQEIKTYYVDKNGKRHRNGYTISPHTKTLQGERELFLSKNAKKFYQMIISENEKRGFTDGYLLLDKNGNRIHDFAINNVLRRLNIKIETIQKANHSIRKTCLSKMIESKVLSNEEIRAFAGHEDFSTTQKHYAFTTKSLSNRADAFEQALSGKLKGNNVTDCNQSA